MRKVVPLPFPPSLALRSVAELGEFIRAARTQSGLTLEIAALSIGVSKQTMTNIEKNPGTVGCEIVMRAAQALGVSLFAVPSQKKSLAQKILLSELKDE